MEKQYNLASQYGKKMHFWKVPNQASLFHLAYYH